MTPLVVRASTRRWTQLAALLTSFERCLEATARLDGARSQREQVTTRDVHDAAALEHRLKVLESRVDREVDRLTVERLVHDLAAKQARHGATAGPW